MINALNRLLAPLRNRVANMVARAVVQLVDDSKKLQSLQLGLLAGETRDDLERFQQYGFTSVPFVGAEAVVAFVGGIRDHGLVLAVDDRRYRLKGLADGEVAIYTDQGDKVVFKRGGTIEITASTKVHILCPLVEMNTDLKVLGKLDVTGKATFADDVDVTKTLTATTDVVGGGKHLKTHTHPVEGTGSTCVNGSPWTGTVTSSAPT